MDSFAFPGLDGYQLLDSGEGEKLERVGAYVFRRPDPQAIWHRRLTAAEWREADFSFVRESDRGGYWDTKTSDLPKDWDFPIDDALFRIHPTPFKHMGLFPEQAVNWAWTAAQGRKIATEDGSKPRLLNLFGYTGVASILASQSGWEVTHLDASRASVDWAAENARRSNLDDRAIRWILDDAARFVTRELRREKQYHGILLDPPHYGRGPNGEKWQFETGIMRLLEDVHQLLAPTVGSFLILSSYAIGCSPLAFDNMLRDLGPGMVETGELWVPEEGSTRRLSCGFCGRWQRQERE